MKKQTLWVLAAVLSALILLGGCSLELPGGAGQPAVNTAPEQTAGSRMVPNDISYLTPNFIYWAVSDADKTFTFSIGNYNANHYYQFVYDTTAFTLVARASNYIRLKLAGAILPRSSDPADNLETYLRYYVFDRRDFNLPPNEHDFGNNIYIC